MTKIALFSGGYDPLHKGHLWGFDEAAQWADMVVVGVNSDEWLRRKKGYVFMPLEHRISIIAALDVVDEALGFNDEDGTANSLISKVFQMTRDSSRRIYFCNGGDVVHCPEEDKGWNDDVINFLYSVGGSGKIESSSDLVRRAYEEMQGDITKLNAGVMVGPW